MSSVMKVTFTENNSTFQLFRRGLVLLLASQSVEELKLKRIGTKVKTTVLPTEKPMTLEACAPLIATLPLEVRGKIGEFIKGVFAVFQGGGDIEFPLPFGRVLSATESFIHGLDEKTSVSLKFTVLNPKGRIRTMVAGGGASVIYADTVGDLGYASELGNYAEYSGAPNEDEER
ncbi:uncharacterized protein A4U43_C08F35390 [Asparagus officinalis]|nr:uncharacterized protein A4U43_C08F35390 [Asparagus officinalis]